MKRPANSPVVAIVGYSGRSMARRLGQVLLFCLVIAALALVSAGCATERAVPELITLTELVPRRVSAGDLVEVRGVGLPVGDVGYARVIFRGALHRPAERPMPAQTIEVENAKLERDKVTFEVTEELLDRFTGSGDEALHTTFRGSVEVWLPGAASALPVHGSVRGISVLEIDPRAPRRAVVEERARHASEAHAFLGLDLEPAGGEGLTVKAVREGSPAARAGLLKDDIIVTFAGVSAFDATDVVPSGRERAAPVAVVRGGERKELSIDVTGYRGDSAREAVGAAAVLGALALLLLFLGTRMATPLSWLSHRLERAAALRAARGGWLLGLVRQATRTESAAGRSVLAAAAPLLVFAGATATFAILPYYELRGRSEVDVTLLYLVSVTSLATMSIITGGASEASAGIRGRLRALATVVVCELPAACALGAVVLSTGSVRATDIAAAQAATQGTFLETGGVPWHWNAVKSPLLFALFACFFLTVLVDGGSASRSLQGADAESASAGVSFRRGAFLFAEWANVLVMCAIGAVTFLGGWYVPGYAVHEHAHSGSLVALGIGCFLLKCWALAALVLLLRAALPLLSPAALMRAGYRAVLPLAAVGLGGAAFVARYPMLPAVERATAFATLAALAVLLGIVAASTIRRRPSSRSVRRFARVNTML